MRGVDNDGAVRPRLAILGHSFMVVVPAGSHGIERCYAAPVGGTPRGALELKKVQAVRSGRRRSQRFYRKLNGILLRNIDGEAGSDDWQVAKALANCAYPSGLASDLDA